MKLAVTMVPRIFLCVLLSIGIEEALSHHADHCIYPELSAANIDQNDSTTVLSNKEMLIWIEKQRSIGKKYFKLGHYDSAAINFQRGITSCQAYDSITQVKDLRHTLLADFAMVKSKKALYHEAIDLVEESIAYFKASDESTEYARTLNIKGLTLYAMGSYDSASLYYKQSLAVLDNTLTTPHEQVGFVCNNLGLLHSRLGEQNLARKYHERAILERKKLYKTQFHSQIAQSHLNLGNVMYWSDDIAAAIRHYEKVVEIEDVLKVPKSENRASALCNLGIMYRANDDLSQAAHYDKRSLKERLAIYRENHPFVADSYFNLGLTKLALGFDLEAMELLDKSIIVRSQSVGKKHPMLANYFNYFGKLFQDKSDFETALKYYHSALLANVPNFYDSLDVFAVPQEITYLNPNFLLQTIHFKITCLEKMNEKIEHQNYLEEITKQVQLADVYIDAIRKNTKSSDDQIKFGEKINLIYESGIDNGIKLYSTSPSVELANVIFQFFEKNKSVALNYFMLEKQSVNLTQIPANLIAKRDSILLAIEKTKSTLVNDMEDDSLKQVMFKLELEKQELVAEFEKKYPQYYAAKYNFEVPSMTDMQDYFQESSNDDALLEFYRGDSTLFAMIITKDTSHLFRFAMDSIVEKDIKNLRKALAANEAIDNTGYQKVYHKIFASIDVVLDHSKIENLTIVNDGVFHHLPLELFLGNALDSDTVKLDFQVNRYNIGYAISSAFWIKNVKSSPSSVSRIVAMAPVNFGTLNYNENDRLDLAKLPKTLDEVNAITTYYNTELYLEKNASEQKLKSLQLDNQILHLATHAEIDDADVDQSNLILQADSLEDGRLHVYELYNMKLNTPLLTLSACNTGYGKILKGEGVLSLARAFTYAGCPNIVMSLWPVNDESTAELMVYFYKNLKDGMRKDEALQQAKQSYLENADPIKSHPYYWAGFIISGDPRSLKFETGNYPYLWVAGILMVGVCSILVLRRKSKRSLNY